MNYLHFQFDADLGDVIEVTIDRAANVQLLNPENFENYKNNRGYRYHGGHATTSPIRFDVPHAGTWHVVIDLGGGTGKVQASSRLISAVMA